MSQCPFGRMREGNYGEFSSVVMDYYIFYTVVYEVNITYAS